MQELNLLMDTGSSWMWVMADLCPKDELECNSIMRKKQFHTDQSSTLKRTGDNIDVCYGSGRCNGGPIVEDNVTFLGDNSTNIDA